VGGSIREYRDRYFDKSPLFLFDRIETPLLIGQGERDGDLTPANVIFNALERLDKPVEFRLYQAEGHVLTQKPNVIDFWQRRLDFFAEHLDLARDSRGTILFEDDRPKSRN
jgi:dipeptidyl aminopeptidase/acylaminoacyl peptidase